MRVTAQLIDPATGAQVWARVYERDVRDVVSLENEIVAAIAREVNLRLTSEEKSRLASARPVDPEAYAAYTKGRFYLNKSTPEEYEKGLTYMQQAIDKDPTNPLPYAALALGYCLIGHGTAPPPDAFVKAKAAALKAEELGGTLAETEAALGQIKLFEEWDWAGAEKDLRHAIALNPSLPEAQRMYSWYLLLVGRTDEAIAAMKRAVEVDPLNAYWNSDLAWQYWHCRASSRRDGLHPEGARARPQFQSGPLLAGLSAFGKGHVRRSHRGAPEARDGQSSLAMGARSHLCPCRPQG